MLLLEQHCLSYEHEKDCNYKMLTMLESVPEANRADARFQQAITLAGHLAACRENWLDRMEGEGNNQVAWFDDQCELSTLRHRFASLETQWTEYLRRLQEDQLAEDFEFPIHEGKRFRLPREVQIVQLTGHASYHRGQIALLVEQLGGTTVDTDYLYWAVPANG